MDLEPGPLRGVIGRAETGEEGRKKVRARMESSGRMVVEMMDGRAVVA